MPRPRSGKEFPTSTYESLEAVVRRPLGAELPLRNGEMGEQMTPMKNAFATKISMLSAGLAMTAAALVSTTAFAQQQPVDPEQGETGQYQYPQQGQYPQQQPQYQQPVQPYPQQPVQQYQQPAQPYPQQQYPQQQPVPQYPTPQYPPPQTGHEERPPGFPGSNPGAAPGARRTGRSDHLRFVNRFGFGYFGIPGVPIADVATAVGSASTVPAPTVGVRYWINEGVGIDGAIGFGYYGGAIDGIADGDNIATGFALAFHVGVPLALAHDTHYKFLVLPELNLGFSSGSIACTHRPTARPPVGCPGATADGQTRDTGLSGFLVDIGIRAGAEIHFGFIGIPQLSLQATVGFNIRYTTGTTSPPGTESRTDDRLMIGTTVQNAPWSIFQQSSGAPAATSAGKPAAYDARPSFWDVLTSNISAIYYF